MSTHFCLGRSFDEIGSDAVNGWIEAQGEGVLIANEALVDTTAPRLTEIARMRGFNFAKREWTEVLALGRMPVTDLVPLRITQWFVNAPAPETSSILPARPRLRTSAGPV